MMRFSNGCAQWRGMALVSMWSLGLLFAGTPVAQSQTAAPLATGSAKPWVYGCEQSADKKMKRCSIVQNLSIKRGEKEQRLLTVVVQPQRKAKNHALLLVLPHGLLLPAGVVIKIDNNKPTKLGIYTSDAKGAYASAPISDELLAAMKKGVRMNVTFVTVARKPVAVPVNLSGFTSSYSKLSPAN